ncbi:hypothetical protein VE04_06000 [Pseudogymnoascus sp. 24MN13]|nr:hypothetical protein VE04_06000 [Pseudogymnoascus sp. 24MN13]
MAPISDKKVGPEAGVDEGYSRLHITPFNASLMAAIVPPSLAPKARNISFHTLQAFPEKEYGFVDLPTEEAGKIKRKLKGALLRGKKIAIEEARGEKAWGEVIDGGEGAEEEGKKKKEKSSKKRKRHEEPMKGAEVLDRQIKRGWTDPKATKKAAKENRMKEGKDKKKEREKSKYTTEAECLFRTTLPPTIAAALPAKGIEGVVVDKERRKRKAGKDVTLHEFAKTEKFATFLRQKSTLGNVKVAVEFVEGKGWVDENGEVVEGEPKKSNHNVDVLKKIAKENKVRLPPAEPVEKSESEEDADTSMQDAVAEVSDTSSSGSSSEDEDDDASEPESENEAEAQSSNALEQPATLAAPSIPPSHGLTISIPPPPGLKSKETASIHPLEALYGRRDQGANASEAPAASSFTFFGDGNNSDVATMTSAAPTPDTAHPHRKHFSWPAEEEDEGDYNTADSPTRKAGGSGEADPNAKEETDPNQDFQKWFYENRGETNRAWKKRQKEVKKEVRQRENRRRVLSRFGARKASDPEGHASLLKDAQKASSGPGGIANKQQSNPLPPLSKAESDKLSDAKPRPATPTILPLLFVLTSSSVSSLDLGLPLCPAPKTVSSPRISVAEGVWVGHPARESKMTPSDENGVEAKEAGLHLEVMGPGEVATGGRDGMVGELMMNAKKAFQDAIPICAAYENVDPPKRGESNKSTDLDSFLERLRLGDKPGKDARSHEAYTALGSDDGEDDNDGHLVPSDPEDELTTALDREDYKIALDVEYKKARAMLVDDDDEEQRAEDRHFARHALAGEDGRANVPFGATNSKTKPLSQQENAAEYVDVDDDWKPYVPEKDDDEWEFQYYMSLKPSEPWSPIDEY